MTQVRDHAPGRFTDIEARRNPTNPYDGLEPAAGVAGPRDLG